MSKDEIKQKLQELALKKPAAFAELLNTSKRTVEKWYLKDGKFPSWVPVFLKLYEENLELKKKLESI